MDDDRNQRDGDERDLDDIFQVGHTPRLARQVRSARRRSILRTIVISCVTVVLILVLAGVTVKVSSNKTMEQRDAVLLAVGNLYNISAPDTYIGQTARYDGIFSGKVVYSTYKLIGGRVAYTGDHEISYGFTTPADFGGGTESTSILSPTFDASELSTVKYNLLGQREMVFFYPFVQYHTYRDDLGVLGDVGQGKIVEMALSFNRGYTLGQVQKMMPNAARISWYWIDDLNPSEKAGVQPQGSEAPRVCSETAAYGIKVYSDSGSLITHPEQVFKESIRYGLLGISRIHSQNNPQLLHLKTEFQRVYDNVYGPGGNGISVFGVVVTGDSKSLASLRGLPFIKASSLGATIDKY